MCLEIKAVLLDFGGTLGEGGLDWDSYHRSIQAYLSSLGHGVALKQVKQALASALAKLERRRSKGLESTFEEVYSWFLAELGIPPNGETLEWLHRNFKNHYKNSFYPCVEAVLEELSTRYKLALVSNTMSDQPRELLAERGWDRFFQEVVCSRDLGVRKPNPEIFWTVLERLGVDPSNAVHVGDSVEADMKGAQAAGLLGVWVRNPGQPAWSGHAVDSICQLPDLLRQLDCCSEN